MRCDNVMIALVCDGIRVSYLETTRGVNGVSRLLEDTLESNEIAGCSENMN